MSRELLAGKVAIVTGAATGIGRAIARKLAANGAAVVVNHLNQPDQAMTIVAEITAAGGRGTAILADVRSRDEVTALFEQAVAQFGSLDILVNNAAVAPIKPIVEVTESDMDAVLAVNVKGMLFGCQMAAKHLPSRGRIINISSSTTGLALPGYGI